MRHVLQGTTPQQGRRFDVRTYFQRAGPSYNVSSLIQRRWSHDRKHQEHGEMTFEKATEILFTQPEEPKRFGWDFHMWQAIVACLPPLAIYLTAKYARQDLKKMEEAEEVKMKALAELQAAALLEEQKSFTRSEKAEIDKTGTAEKANGKAVDSMQEKRTGRPSSTQEERQGASKEPVYKLLEAEVEELKKLVLELSLEVKRSAKGGVGTTDDSEQQSGCPQPGGPMGVNADKKV